MEFIAQNKWLVKVIAFFAVVGIIRASELLTSKEFFGKQDFISLVVITLALQIFGAITK